MDGIGIFLLDSRAFGGLPAVLPATGTVSCITAPMMATPGRCFVNLALYRDNEFEDYVQEAGVFDLHTSDRHGIDAAPGRDWMMCVIDQDWAMNQERVPVIANVTD